MGSWMTTLPRVRDSCPGGWAGKRELARDGPYWRLEGWAKALRDAQDNLAWEGAYLDAHGEVCADPPEDAVNTFISGGVEQLVGILSSCR